MTRPRSPGAAAALLAAAALSACAGEGDAFKEQANATCADFERRIDAVAAPADLDELAGSAEEIAGLIAEGTDDLRRLEPPDGLAAAWEDWLALNEEAAANARAISEAAAAGDREQIVELAEVAEENEAEADALAEELGLADCVVE